MSVLFAHGGFEIHLLDGACERAVLMDQFRVIACEQGWHVLDDLRADVPNAMAIAAVREGKVIGGIELQRADESGFLPICSVWPELRFSITPRTAELVLLAIERPRRGRIDLLWMLTTEMWRQCLRLSIRELLIEVPTQNLRVYRRIGWPLTVIGGVREHWGEECYACSLDLCAVRDVALEKLRKVPDLAFIEHQAFRP